MPSKRRVKSPAVNTSIKYFGNLESILLISSNSKYISNQLTETTQLQFLSIRDTPFKSNKIPLHNCTTHPRKQEEESKDKAQNSEKKEGK